MRGTLKPQMSASSTPTVRPLAARAAARLTVTEDLPTPPLPELMATTRVRGPTEVCSSRWAMLNRARSMARRLPSASSSVHWMRTSRTPGSEPTLARTSRWS